MIKAMAERVDRNETVLIDELRMTLGKLELALGAISEAIVWTNETGVIEWCNSAFDRLVVRPHIEILGRDLIETLPLERAGKIISKDAHPLHLVHDKQLQRDEPYDFHSGRREVSLEISGTRVELGTVSLGTVLVLVIRDVTERNQMERDLQNRTRELERSNLHLHRREKLMENILKELHEANAKVQEAAEIKSEFTSTVSHELRTPLTSIKEGIDIVLDGTVGGLNTEQQECLQIAKRNVDRLARLINSVLNYQKLESGHVEFSLQPHDLNAIVHEAIEEVQTLASKKGLKLKSDLATLPLVVCDRDKIIAVMVNLLGNAIKFSNSGQVVITSERRDRWARIAVCDEGPGIKEEDQGKLFQSFRQLSQQGERKTGGTGLGLAISRKIIEHHHGDIGVTSVYGSGATFYFDLPLEGES